jgi:glycosyltransferase involved in cell wall biosynthesis
VGGRQVPNKPNQQRSGGLRNKGYFKRSYEGRPLISVITVVYNAEQYLEKTILSVINQTYDNVEYIIVDGASTDGTLNIIERYENSIDYWLSEKDSGIYYAMNKGIKTASGNWVNFMNAGDSYHSSDIIQSIVALVEETFNEMKLIYGNANIFNLEVGINRKVGRTMDMHDVYMRMPTCHQAIFYDLQLFKAVGLYDTEYKIIADHEWFVRFLKQYGQKHLRYLNETIVNYSMEGFSTRNALLSAQERLNLHLKHFPFLSRRKETLKYYAWCLRAIVMKFVKKTMLYRKLKAYI